MKIIAFDLGKNFAWAHNCRRKLTSKCVLLKGETRAHRLGNALLILPELFKKHKFDIVIYETPFTRGYAASRFGWGLAGVIEACASEANLPVVDAAVPTIKKFATGNGWDPKSGMIVAAQKFGYKGKNEHEADAICLLRYAEANLERVNV